LEAEVLTGFIKSQTKSLLNQNRSREIGRAAETDIRKAALVDASLALFAAACAHLLPTPLKPHYTFNLRDLSKLFQGLSLLGGPVDSVAGLLRLWVHEASV
jgi:hypothetical protein